MEVLPSELWLEIFLRLSTVDDAINSALVCKRFLELILSTSFIQRAVSYKEVNFGNVVLQKSFRFLKVLHGTVSEINHITGIYTENVYFNNVLKYSLYKNQIIDTTISTFYKNDSTKHGPYVKQIEDMIIEGTYIDNLPVGVWKQTEGPLNEGFMFIQREFNNQGKLHGRAVTKINNAEVFEVNYSNGEKEGLYIIYLPNLTVRGCYHKNKKHGSWNYLIKENEDQISMNVIFLQDNLRSAYFTPSHYKLEDFYNYLNLTFHTIYETYDF